MTNARAFPNRILQRRLNREIGLHWLRTLVDPLVVTTYSLVVASNVDTAVLIPYAMYVEWQSELAAIEEGQIQTQISDPDPDSDRSDK